MSENFVENHTSTEAAPSWEPSIDLCEKIGNNPPNHPTHISLGSHCTSVRTTREADVLQRVFLITHPQQTNRWFHLHLAGKMNYQASLPASRREEYFLPFFKMSISGVILNGWAAECWCLTWGHGQTAITDLLLVVHKGSFFAGVTRAGRPSSKYATTAASPHVFFFF